MKVYLLVLSTIVGGMCFFYGAVRAADQPAAPASVAAPANPAAPNPGPPASSASVLPGHVEFTLTITDAPELKDFAEKAMKDCEDWYPKISLMLPSANYTPPTHIDLEFTNSYKGVAATAGTHIFCSPAYFKAHPDDIGALVHECVHVVQHYHHRGNPGWLVEGIADYIRWNFYEPKPRPGRLDPDQVKYSDSYRRTAAFLAFATQKAGKDIVAPLNAAMREGTYSESMWKDLTGRTLTELGDDWKASLRAHP